MIRDIKELRVSLLTTLVIVFMASVMLIHSVAWAGDADGVLGYSMRLKNKDITTETGAGSGGAGLVVGPATDPKVAFREPMFTSSPRESIFVQAVSYFFENPWAWMFMRTR